jgi:hypothetical protein
VQARTLLLTAALLVAGPAAAAEPPPSGIPGLIGPRALALQANVAVASSNDALFVNPAALGARRRYSVDVLYTLEQRGSTPASQYVGTSVADSVSAAVTAAAGYVWTFEGDYTGSLYQAALAAPFSDGFLVGVTTKYLDLDGPRPVGAATVDAGIFWQVSRYLSIGGAGYNLVPIDNAAVAPMAAAAGLAIGSDESFQFAAEWYANFDTPQGTLHRYSAGAEYLLAKLFAVRAGYAYDEIQDSQRWSAGFGLVTGSVALEAGYQQDVSYPQARTMSFSLRVFPSM